MGHGKADIRGRGVRLKTLFTPVNTMLAFCAGVISIRLLPGLPAEPIVFAMGGLGIGMLWFGWLRMRSAMLPAAFVLGFAWAVWVADSTLSDWLSPVLEKQDLLVTGYIAGPIIPRGRGGRFDFRVITASLAGKRVAAPSLIRLTAYEDDLLPAHGGRWKLLVRLKRPRGLVNFDAAFQYETWLFQAGIGATGYVVKTLADRAGHQPGILSGAMQAVEQVRMSYPAFLAANVIDSRNAAILSALTVGRRDGLDQAAWSVLRDTGTAHLVAISGLHIGLLAVLAAGIMSWIWRMLVFPCRWLPAPVAAGLAAALAGTAYALLAGFTLPTRRALCMLLVGVSALVARRMSSLPHMLLLALTLILLFDPLAPFSASFWLSFAAVAVLAMMVCGSRDNAVEASGMMRRGARILGSWCRAQGWLLLGMLPVLSTAFHQVSLVAPLANLVAVPLVGMLVVPLGLISLLAWSAGAEGLAAVLVVAAEKLLDWVWQLLDALMHLPLSTWITGPPSSWDLALALTGLLILMFGRALPAWPLGFVLLIPLLSSGVDGPPRGSFDVTLLDSGQGLSVLVRTRHHAMIYDTGAAYSGGFDIGESVVVPALRRHGLQEIDLLVVSHGDNDHIGGARAVADAVRVKRYLTGAPGSPRGPAGGEACKAGASWHWDSVQFEVLWPLQEAGSAGNNGSCVIRVESPAGSLLLTGDIESSAEWGLVRELGAGLRSDILLVPHHGSKTSSSTPFLNVVVPKLALVSAGYRNRFRHPFDGVMSRYRERQIPVLNAATEGAVSVAVRDDGLHVRGARADLGAFWIDRSPVNYRGLNDSLRRIDMPVLKSSASPIPNQRP